MIVVLWFLGLVFLVWAQIGYDQSCGLFNFQFSILRSVLLIGTGESARFAFATEIARGSDIRRISPFPPTFNVTWPTADVFV